MRNLYAIKQRINIRELEPKAYEILYAMEKYLSTTDLSSHLRELIKIRVSQINGCAFCIQLHTKEALENGEETQRIFSLTTWHESPLFSIEERSVLELADEVTNIADKGVSEQTFQKVKKYFTQHQVAQMIIAINQINFWNRIAISTKMFHKTD